MRPPASPKSQIFSSGGPGRARPRRGGSELREVSRRTSGPDAGRVAAPAGISTVNSLKYGAATSVAAAPAPPRPRTRRPRRPRHCRPGAWPAARPERGTGKTHKCGIWRDLSPESPALFMLYLPGAGATACHWAPLFLPCSPAAALQLQRHACGSRGVSIAQRRAWALPWAGLARAGRLAGRQQRTPSAPARGAWPTLESAGGGPGQAERSLA